MLKTRVVNAQNSFLLKYYNTLDYTLCLRLFISVAPLRWNYVECFRAPLPNSTFHEVNLVT